MHFYHFSPNYFTQQHLRDKTLTFRKPALILATKLAMRKTPCKRNPYSRDKIGLTDFSLKSRFCCLVFKNTVLSKCFQKNAEMLVSLSLPVVTQQQNSSQPLGCENSTCIWGLLRAPFSAWCLKELRRYLRLSISTLCFTRRSLSRRSRSSWPRMGSMENSLRKTILSYC